MLSAIEHRRANWKIRRTAFQRLLMKRGFILSRDRAQLVVYRSPEKDVLELRPTGWRYYVRKILVARGADIASLREALGRPMGDTHRYAALTIDDLARSSKNVRVHERAMSQAHRNAIVDRLFPDVVR